MKRQYSKLSMSMEIFEANEYIANCVKINCSKPDTFGVFYEERNYLNGYQDKAINFLPDKPLTACGNHGDNALVIKEDSIRTYDKLYYDSNGTIPGGVVSKEYYFKDENGKIHYFLNWQSTGTLAS